MNEDQVASTPSFRKEHSKPLNIWHWSNLLIIAGILITVLLAKTIFSGKENIPLVQNALEKKGVTITLEQAKAVTKLYTQKLWDWHVYFGYALSGLFLFRILLEFFQVVDQKFFRTLKNARHYLRLKSNEKQTTKHFLNVRYIYLLFYLNLVFMVASGLFIKFSDGYSDLKPIRSAIKDIHNIGMYVILSFIFIHLAGLLIFEQSKKRTESKRK